MASVTLRFYEELSSFLPPQRRKRDFSVDLPAGYTVKAVIEDLGVPHTEIDLVLANGESVDFSYRPSDGDRISVYPMFESWDISAVSRVRPAPLRELKFALDVHLGRLAGLLRMFGFDAFYGNSLDDESLVRVARRERRVILTRDRGLLKRRTVTHGYLVRSAVPRDQMREVVRRFDLGRQARLGSRCIACNAVLERVEKAQAAALVPPVVAALYDEFSRCPGCGRIFWRGSHWGKMRELADDLGLNP